MSFASELKERAFAPRAVIAGKDATTLAEDILAMSQEEFSAAFRKSPMKRAELAGLKRNARVVLERTPASASWRRVMGAGADRCAATCR